MNILKILIASAFLCACAHGQVIIYKNKITLIRTGGGSTTKSKIAGYTVINATNGAVTRIEVTAASKNFSVFTISYTVNTVRGSLGKEYLVFSYADFYTDANNNQVEDSETVKGLNTKVDIGEIASLQDWSIPKTMQLVGRTIYTASGQPTLDELAGTLAYDKKNTEDANFLTLTYEEVVERIKTLLRNQGYTPV